MANSKENTNNAIGCLWSERSVQNLWPGEETTNHKKRRRRVATVAPCKIEKKAPPERAVNAADVMRSYLLWFFQIALQRVAALVHVVQFVAQPRESAIWVVSTTQCRCTLAFRRHRRVHHLRRRWTLLTGQQLQKTTTVGNSIKLFGCNQLKPVKVGQIGLFRPQSVKLSEQ